MTPTIWANTAALRGLDDAERVAIVAAMDGGAKASKLAHHYRVPVSWVERVYDRVKADRRAIKRDAALKQALRAHIVPPKTELRLGDLARAVPLSGRVFQKENI